MLIEKIKYGSDAHTQARPIVKEWEGKRSEDIKNWIKYTTGLILG